MRLKKGFALTSKHADLFTSHYFIMYFRAQLTKLFCVIAVSLGSIFSSSNSQSFQPVLDKMATSITYATPEKISLHLKKKKTAYSVLLLHKSKLKMVESFSSVMGKRISLEGGGGSSLMRVSNIDTTPSQLYIGDDIILNKYELDGLKKIMYAYLQQNRRKKERIAGNILSSRRNEHMMKVIYFGVLSSSYPNLSTGIHLFQLRHDKVSIDQYGKKTSSKFFYLAVVPQATLYDMEWKRSFHKGIRISHSISRKLDKLEI